MSPAVMQEAVDAMAPRVDGRDLLREAAEVPVHTHTEAFLS
jgi:hypothetical protein